MAQNPKQFCSIERQTLESGAIKTLDLTVGNRQLVFGRDVRPRIVGTSETLLVQQTGDVVAALRLSDRGGDDTCFATVGDDTDILIWTAHGTLDMDGRLAGHTLPVLRLWELTGSRLVSWAADQKLCVWDTSKRPAHAASQPRLLVRIPTRLRSPDFIVMLATGNHVALRTPWWWRTRIHEMTPGGPVVTLCWTFRPLTNVHQSVSGTWITAANSRMRWWRNGRSRRMPKFSFADGYLEGQAQPNGQPDVFWVISDQHEVHLFAARGARRSACPADAGLAKQARQYVLAHARATPAVNAAQAYISFGVRDNPLFDDPVASDSSNPSLPMVQSAVSQFFKRPRYDQIRGWLREEVKAARDARAYMSRVVRRHSGMVQRAMQFVWLWLALTVLTSAALFVISTPWQRGPVAAISVCFTLLALWSFWTARTSARAIRVLRPLQDHIDALLRGIDAERARIRRGLPSFGSYRGRAAKLAIEQTIRGQLMQTAFAACYLHPRHLITPAREPIIVRDWSLFTLSEQWSHIRSFWWAPDGTFMLAVERVQFVFVTQQSVLVYCVDYDFITDSTLRASVHSVERVDIVDIIIRDIVRQVDMLGQPVDVAAKELAIVSRAGEYVSLIGMHEHSADALRGAARARLAQIAADRLRDVRSDLRQPATATPRRLLRAELIALTAEGSSGSRPDLSRQRTAGDLDAIKQLI